MRRTIATLLVVASPVLMAVPVDAGESRPAVPAALTATPAVPQPAADVAAPEVVAPPAVPAAVAATPAVRAPARAAAAVRPVVRTVRAKAPAVAPVPTPVADAAYSARLHAELCQARAVFCGLDRGGRYQAG